MLILWYPALHHQLLALRVAMQPSACGMLLQQQSGCLLLPWGSHHPVCFCLLPPQQLCLLLPLLPPPEAS